MEMFRTLVRTPAVYESVEAVIRWPVFLKPDVGQGSKGIAVATNAESCHLLRERDPSLLMMEYLPGPEFTID